VIEGDQEALLDAERIRLARSEAAACCTSGTKAPPGAGAARVLDFAHHLTR
jgi:hypothetical protein